MGLSEEAEKEILKQHQDLCKSLNLDKASGTEAWKSFCKVYDCYILESDPVQWLGCAIYVACRYTSTPAVGKTNVFVQGNLVNLARLLKLINLSLVEFLVKLKKWAALVQLSEDFLKKLDQLERNFTVSVVIFKKFQPIFADMFLDPALENSKSLKTKKYKVQPSKVWRTFEFTWTLFICVKSRYPKISDDLVSSYHLLLACCDFVFINAFLSGRKDLINENFQVLGDNKNLKDMELNETPCIIDHLCDRHNGVAVEVKAIKEYSLKNHIKMLFERKILKGNSVTLTDILDSNYFEHNIKGINRNYEEYVLSAGDFDERIFFGDYEKFCLHGAGDSREKSLIGCSIAAVDFTPSNSSELKDKLTAIADQLDTKRLNGVSLNKTVCPMTPLTGRRYLDNKECSSKDSLLTGNISAVSALQNLLDGREAIPSEYLLSFIGSCSREMEKSVNNMAKNLSEHLALEKPNLQNMPENVIKKVEDMVKKLYYKLLEPILTNEVQKSSFDANLLLVQDIFHKTLFSCASEIVLFSHNCHRPFQWILSTVGISPYHFYRIIEIVVRTEPSLTRELVKHLNMIEETILESLAWQRDSPLWRGIIDSGKPIPSCEDVTTHSMSQEGEYQSLDNAGKNNLRNNSVDKLALLAGKESILTQSPGGPLSERFSSPQLTGKRPANDINISDGPPTKLTRLSGYQVQHKECSRTVKDNRRPKRTGAIALFFRKFYYLASVRMQDMCHQLNLTDVDLRRKIWTCFELSIVNHVGLMLDRHLDQMLMCAVYIICRIVGPKKPFTDVMGCYRNQPQARSGVYRNVLVAPDTSLEDLQNDCNRQEAEEERGDLIKFYNSVYVRNVQNLLLRFKQENCENERIVLSPIPVSKSPPGPKKVTENFALFLRIQGQETCETPTTNHKSYCFHQSPAKNLQAINKMVKLDGYRTSKKLLVNDEDDKQRTISRLVSRKVQFHEDNVTLTQE